MLIEASAIMVLFFPVIGLPAGFLGIIRNRAHWRAYAFCMAVFVGCVAYCYHPTIGSDIVNYYKTIESYGQMTFREALLVDNDYSGLYALNIFFWLIGRIGDVRIAQGFTTFVVYYVAYYITCHMAEDMKVRTRHLVFYLAFITMALNLPSILNNIRNIFAFSLIGLAIFRDSYLKKRNLGTLLLYVVGITFHSTGIVLVLFRFLISAKGKRRIVLFVLILLMNTFVNYLFENYYNSLSSGGTIRSSLQEFLLKAYQYYNDTESDWSVKVAASGQQTFQRIFYMAIMFGLGALGFMGKKYENVSRMKMRDWNKPATFALFCIALSVSCIGMAMPEYWRFAMIAIAFGAPLYFAVVEDIPPNSQMYTVIHMTGAIMGAACMALWIWYIWHNGDVFKIILEPLIAGPFFVMLKDLAVPLFG